MRSITLTQNKITLVDDEYYTELSKYKWFYHGYAERRGLTINGKRVAIRMHRVVVELSGEIIPLGMEVDHKSRDKLDNRRDNLRVVSRSQNEYNRTVYNNNTSGYKGVCKLDNKWIARIRMDGVSIYLGFFSNITDAAHAYDKAAKEFHKEFAVLNFPEE
jgi:hypothetical protein